MRRFLRALLPPCTKEYLFMANDVEAVIDPIAYLPKALTFQKTRERPHQWHIQCIPVWPRAACRHPVATAGKETRQVYRTTSVAGQTPGRSASCQDQPAVVRVPHIQLVCS